MPSPLPHTAPRSFLGYLRSWGPGLVMVLTWLGAGDVVECSVSGGSYGYALAWVLVLALVIRFFFVSVLAKYQLCNQHGENLLDGLGRLHPAFVPFLWLMAIGFGHIYASYAVLGTGEACALIVHEVLGDTVPLLASREFWSVFWCAAALVLILRGLYSAVEKAFFVLLALLGASFLGVAAWVTPDFAAMAEGFAGFQMPREAAGSYASVFLAVSVVGAVVGSMANLLYPYFLAAKGWHGPRWRRVQLYDLAFGVAVMIVLDLAVWALGAEVLQPAWREQPVDPKNMDMSDLAPVLGTVLGHFGVAVFYAGIFAVVFTTVVGISMGMAYLSTDCWVRWRQSRAQKPDFSRKPGFCPAAARSGEALRRHMHYKAVVVWCVLSPLAWYLLPERAGAVAVEQTTGGVLGGASQRLPEEAGEDNAGRPGFVHMTVVANALSVLVLPVLTLGLWIITARTRYIGAEHRNRWWENLVVALVLVLSIYMAVKTVQGLAAG